MKFTILIAAVMAVFVVAEQSQSHADLERAMELLTSYIDQNELSRMMESDGEQIEDQGNSTDPICWKKLPSPPHPPHHMVADKEISSRIVGGQNVENSECPKSLPFDCLLTCAHGKLYCTQMVQYYADSLFLSVEYIEAGKLPEAVITLQKAYRRAKAWKKCSAYEESQPSFGKFLSMLRSAFKLQ